MIMNQEFKDELKKIKTIQETAHELEVDVYKRFEKHIKEWFNSKTENKISVVFKVNNRYVLYDYLETAVWDLNNKVLTTFRIHGLVLNEQYANVDAAFKSFLTFDMDSEFEVVEYSEFIEKFEAHKNMILAKEEYDFQWNHAAIWRFHDDVYEPYYRFFNDEITHDFIDEMMKREEE
jgi:hypothetical protein